MADAPAARTMEPVWTALRVLHIGAGIALVGGATLWGAVLAPVLQQLGPTLPKGAFPTLGGRVVRYLPHAALATFLTGVALYALMQGAYAGPWRMLMLGALVLMLVALGLSYGVLVPTFKKVAAGMASAPPGPPGPEAQALMHRMKTASMANLAVAWLIVVLMVVATALRTT
jgi:hypothetical protein